MDGKDRKLTREILKRYEKDIKGYAIVITVLAIISAFILLIDKYYADSPIWWAVMVPAVGGYLYLRIHRDLHWNPLNTGKRQAAPYHGPDTTLTDPESERSFSFSDVDKIEIETTGDGPFDEDLYWIFYLQLEAPVRMAGPVALEQGVFDALKEFDGVDFRAAIQAAATVEPALFLIWEKVGNE